MTPANGLKHVYWIGGGSGAGKSTLAQRLAAEYGFQLYSTDDAMAEHARRSTPRDCPLLHRFMAMDMDERWVIRSPHDMLETFHWFRGEAFKMIIEDVLDLPADPAIIVEGFRLLPNLVHPLLAERSRAIWLLPDAEFRETVFKARGGQGWSFLAKTSDPNRALRNLLERDALFTDFLRSETARLELNSIEVRTTLSEAELTQRTAQAFRL